MINSLQWPMLRGSSVKLLWEISMILSLRRFSIVPSSLEIELRLRHSYYRFLILNMLSGIISMSELTSDSDFSFVSAAISSILFILL
jgi:hypothetical protein